MTRKEIMKEAHIIAKALEGSYSARMSYSMKLMWSVYKLKSIQVSSKKNTYNAIITSIIHGEISGYVKVDGKKVDIVSSKTFGAIYQDGVPSNKLKTDNNAYWIYFQLRIAVEKQAAKKEEKKIRAAKAAQMYNY